MEFINYSLSIGNRLLLRQVNVRFDAGTINHLLGNNGTGKSCFAKSCVGVLPYTGEIKVDTQPVLIGSYSNIPFDLTLNDIIHILERKYSQNSVAELAALLDIHNITKSLKIKKLSDGQKQKIKLLFFLIAKPSIIILDEFTSALDKSSTLEMYRFLTTYVKKERVTCINITHNLSDLENMPGRYFLLSQQKIVSYKERRQIVDIYIKGDY